MWRQMDRWSRICARQRESRCAGASFASGSETRIRALSCRLKRRPPYVSSSFRRSAWLTTVCFFTVSSSEMRARQWRWRVVTLLHWAMTSINLRALSSYWERFHIDLIVNLVCPKPIWICWITNSYRWGTSKFLVKYELFFFFMIHAYWMLIVKTHDQITNALAFIACIEYPKALPFCLFFVAFLGFLPHFECLC